MTTCVRTASVSTWRGPISVPVTLVTRPHQTDKAALVSTAKLYSKIYCDVGLIHFINISILKSHILLIVNPAEDLTFEYFGVFKFCNCDISLQILMNVQL